MNRGNYIAAAIWFVVLGLLQVTVLRNLMVFDTGSCFIYVLALVLVPLELSAVILMIIGFLYGIAIDTFYDTAGIHAASSVLVMYLRPGLIRLLTPGGGYDAGTRLAPGDLGWTWMISYLAPLIFIHHLALFFIEAGNLTTFWLTLGKAALSAVFTLLVSLLILYVRMPQRRSRL